MCVVKISSGYTAPEIISFLKFKLESVAAGGDEMIEDGIAEVVGEGDASIDVSISELCRNALDSIASLEYERNVWKSKQSDTERHLHRKAADASRYMKQRDQLAEALREIRDLDPSREDEGNLIATNALQNTGMNND